MIYKVAVVIAEMEHIDDDNAMGNPDEQRFVEKIQDFCILTEEGVRSQEEAERIVEEIVNDYHRRKE